MHWRISYAAFSEKADEPDDLSDLVGDSVVSVMVFDLNGLSLELSSLTKISLIWGEYK